MKGKDLEHEYIKTKEPRTDEVLRLTVSKAAESALNVVVEKVNDGFNGGRVNRTQAVSWILQRFAENLSDSDIREIRAQFFDELAVLESILRRAKETGQVPVELKGLLQKELGLDETPRKKSKKSLQENDINDVI